MTTVLESSLNHQQLNWVPHELKVLCEGETKALVLLYYCGLDGTSTTSLRYIVLLWSFQPWSRCTDSYSGSLIKYIPTQGNNPGRIETRCSNHNQHPRRKVAEEHFQTLSKQKYYTINFKMIPAKENIITHKQFSIKSVSRKRDVT